MKKGKVYLIGAGPGAPDLITIKGRRCLEMADVVIYDRLVDQRLVSQAGAGAERIYVGKAPGSRMLSQEGINDLLVVKAKEGKLVARLKGGDPFVLGRGGEEAEALVKDGIPFEVVPGVTAAVAAPAYAGIPVTHRRLASSFAVVTGHEDPTKEESTIAWQGLATGVDTLVFLMGLANLKGIASELMKHDRPGTTPAALVYRGTEPEQRTVTGTLADIADRAAQTGLESPVALVVGQVVSLRDTLRWFDNRPLFGKKVLVTRSRRQASVLTELLSAEGALPLELPTIAVAPVPHWDVLDRVLSRLAELDWIVFTSVNGVEVFFQRLHHHKLDARALHRARLVAVGPATAQALEEQGLCADVTPQEYTTQGILSSLKGEKMAGARVLLPRAQIASEELAQGLVAMGAEIEQVATYRTSLAPERDNPALELLLAGQVDVVTFTSSSTVRGLAQLLADNLEPLHHTLNASIGPVTSATARELGIRVDVEAQEHTIPGLVQALTEHYARANK